MRSDGHIDLVIAASLALCLSPAVETLARAKPEWSWICTSHGSQKSPNPERPMPGPCHACIPSRDDEEDSAG